MIKQRLSENAVLIEQALRETLAEQDVDFAEELEAERYSLLARAKRIRPTLVLEFCRMFGGRDEAAIPFAMAVEMVHTYSLIHDDLPCMDNDDLRRGLPTCHKVYGEATALLAGDGLLTRAFGVLASNREVSGDAVRDAVAALSRAAGSFGMIGGQVMDLAGEEKKLSLTQLKKLHANKTGAMIAVSAKLGCLAAGLDVEDARTKAAVEYAKGIGLAFQIVDDVLDVIATEDELGKPIGSDAQNQKTTFLTYYSIEQALQQARELTDGAKKALAGMENNAVLLALADYLTERKN